MIQHFEERCRERGIVNTNIADLFKGLQWAIRSKRWDLVEKVAEGNGSKYWRFKCPDGIFYAVTPKGKHAPVTVFTQEMMRQKKWAIKAERGRKKSSKPRG